MAKPTPLEASDHARRRNLEAVPPRRDQPAEESESEVTSWQGPSGWDEERLRGIPVISFRSSSARRDTLPHVAGVERADRALGLRRAAAWYTNGREGELRAAAAAVPERPHATRLLRQRCESVVDALPDDADEEERLLALSYVCWPGENDPHRELLQGDDPPLAGEEDVRRFVAECCEPGDGTLVRDLRAALEQWCVERALVPLNPNRVGCALGKMGYPSTRLYRTGGHVYVYDGLALR